MNSVERSEMFRNRVKSYNCPEYEVKWEKLCGILDSLGEGVVVPHLEPDFDIDALLAEGGLFHGQVLVNQMEMSNCHDNSLRIWGAGEGAWATGYGYTAADEMWRQHSWVLLDDARIVETTVPRDLYFGIVKLTKGDRERMMKERGMTL